MKYVTTAECDGDSFQACLATLFELHPAQVPKFDLNNDQEFMDELFSFLLPHGLYPYFPYIHELNIRTFDRLRGNYLLGGMDDGFEARFVIATGRAITVFDPLSPDEPNKLRSIDGYYAVLMPVKLL